MLGGELLGKFFGLFFLVFAKFILINHVLLDFLLDLNFEGLENRVSLEAVVSRVKLCFNDTKMIEDAVLNLCGCLHF